MMKHEREKFSGWQYTAFVLATLVVMALCICVGSVSVPLSNTFHIIKNAVLGLPQTNISESAILLSVRIPRVLTAALVGAALSVGGASMQGLLKNPLADGSTLGVSAGASLGAVLSIALGITIPGLPFLGTAGMAMLFSFGSLIIILSLAYKMDYSLATNTIILMGVVYAMFVSSITTLVITFSPEKIKEITFWTLGDFTGASYKDAALVFSSLLIFGSVLLLRAKELNAFSIGEDNARHVGVNVRAVKLIILASVSALTGVCVSVSGTIAFVGLVTPHIVRMITGPNHYRLLPASVLFGAMLLMLCDLAARSLFSPRILPIGVLTSIVGSIVFVYVFNRSKKMR